MDCTYIELYPAFTTPQSALNTTCHHSPFHTSFMVSSTTCSRKLTFTHIHTHWSSGATQGSVSCPIIHRHVDCTRWDRTHNLLIERRLLRLWLRHNQKLQGVTGRLEEYKILVLLPPPLEGNTIFFSDRKTNATQRKLYGSQ